MNTHVNEPTAALARARLALEGLSIGDAFGERFFGSPAIVERRLRARALPSPPWYWTDDTAMALSVYEVLSANGRVDPDALATRFAETYRGDPMRGYGGTAHEILHAIGLGLPWRQAASTPFGGQGSMGNGSAMRVAPIGGYFADDLDEVVRQAQALGGTDACPP
jgi:ADP-ribosylglycohydrolase